MPRLTSRSRSGRDRVVTVTGAASGMGRAIAHLFADEGARVAVTDRDARGVDTVAGEIVEAGGLATGWTLDVADPETIVQVVGEVVQQLGPVDILVNDAGASIPVEIGADDFETAWATTLAIKLTAQARMIRACRSILYQGYLFEWRTGSGLANLESRCPSGWLAIGLPT